MKVSEMPRRQFAVSSAQGPKSPQSPQNPNNPRAKRPLRRKEATFWYAARYGEDVFGPRHKTPRAQRDNDGAKAIHAAQPHDFAEQAPGGLKREGTKSRVFHKPTTAAFVTQNTSNGPRFL